MPRPTWGANARRRPVDAETIAIRGSLPLPTKMLSPIARATFGRRPTWTERPTRSAGSAGTADGDGVAALAVRSATGARSAGAAVAEGQRDRDAGDEAATSATTNGARRVPARVGSATTVSALTWTVAGL